MSLAQLQPASPSWYTNVHLHPFSYPASPHGPRNGPRGWGQPRWAGGQAGWPRSARNRRCRPAGDVQSRLLGTAAAGVHRVGRCMMGIGLSPALLGPWAWSLDVVDLLPVRESLSRARSSNLLLAASTPQSTAAEAMRQMEERGRGGKPRPPGPTSVTTLLGPKRLSQQTRPPRTE